jgi:hypothetical protein
MEQALHDFYTHLNEAVVTTNDFSEGTKFRKREKVDQFAYCGLNPMYRSYLSFDLDMPGSAFRFEEVNLPPPTIITINPDNTHCHMLYRLVTPVAYTKNARSGPQDYFEAIQREMEHRLGADIAYNHTITKNPLHPRWKVITHPAAKYHLGDFLEWIDLPRKSFGTPTTQVYKGRNHQLFDTLLRWSYSAVHVYENEERWYAAVLAKAEEINAATFGQPLGFSEIKATARSTAKRVWKRRHEPNHSRPRVLTFTDESSSERMRQGAAYTNTLRREKSLQTLQEAFNALRAKQGDQISVRQLVEHTGMNIKTVRKYLPHLGQPHIASAVTP